MTLSTQVRRVLEGESISEAELQEMVEKSAITSIDGFNRRFLDWLFIVQDGEITRMACLAVKTFGKGKDKVFEDHDLCKGAGCKGCGWRGYIVRLVHH